jgi:hypothetical protein
MEYLSESTQLLYAQLLTQCLHGGAPSGRGLSFVRKQIQGATHWYLQLTVGSTKTQHYLGPDSEGLRQIIEQEKSLWEKSRTDLADRQKLVAMLVSGGAHTVSASEARLFELLECAGVFLVGGVLVGSHAFGVYGNMLGVKWDSATTRTQDVDIAHSLKLEVGLRDKAANLRQALIDAEMGFIEVPALNRKSPSTRFHIRGKQFSVDILTPMHGKTTSTPIYISALDTYAEPVRFLDFLLEDIQRAVIVAKAGILVNVPSPARFALHKLVISQRRTAKQLLRVLIADRPGDLLLAWEAASAQPGKFMEQLRSGLESLSPPLREALKDLVPT